MNAISRRSFVAGAAFGTAGTVVALPVVKPAAAPAVISDAESIALFAKLSPKHQDYILSYALFLLDQQERGR